MASLEKGYSLLYHWYVVSQMSYLFEVIQIVFGVTEEYDVYVWDYPDVGRDAMIENYMEPDIVTDLAGEAVTGLI